MEELYSVCWNITSKCNKNCKFCYRRICEDSTLEENKKIFNNLNEIKKLHKIGFCGGEPLLYPFLFELIEYIKQKNEEEVQISLTTNASLINEKNIGKIISTFDWITLDVDSLNDKINEKIGRGNEYLVHLKKVLDWCNGKTKIKINSVASQFNISEFPQIYKFLCQYEIKRWKIMRFFCVEGNSKKNKELFELSDEQFKEIQDVLHEICDIHFDIQFNDLKHYKSYLNIYADGSVTITNDIHGKYVVIGNLLEENINKILKQNHTLLKSHYERSRGIM